MPALLTSASMRPPNRPSAASQILAGAAGSARSPAISSSLPRVEWPTILWPVDLSSAKAAAPMPRLAPVIRMFIRGRLAPPIPHCEERMRLGRHPVDERLRSRLEIGDLFAEAAEALLDLVNVLGDILGVAADRCDGRTHRIRGERRLVDCGGDHRHRLRLQFHRLANAVGRALHFLDRALNRAVSLDGLPGRLLDRSDLGGNVIGGPSGLRSEALHLLCDDRETAAR